MGYTHYFEGSVSLDPTTQNEVRKLIIAGQRQGIVLAGWDGTGEPTVNDEEIRLNGDASADLDHETFAILNDNSGFGFCKTALKPYDAVVGAILILLAEKNSTFSVSSDGTWEDDWEGPRGLYLSTFNRVPESILS